MECPSGSAYYMQALLVWSRYTVSLRYTTRPAYSVSMARILVNLDALLEQRGVSRYKVAMEAQRLGGVAASSVYAMIRGDIAPRLDTLAVVIEALENVSEQSVHISEILTYDRTAAPRVTERFTLSPSETEPGRKKMTNPSWVKRARDELRADRMKALKAPEEE